MKPLRWTAHALKGIADREIIRETAEHAIRSPEDTAPNLPGRVVRMRIYWDTDLEQEMLLRCVVEEHPEEIVVITVYTTSQIARYLRRAR
jgi:hypothetical protein